MGSPTRCKLGVPLRLTCACDRNARTPRRLEGTRACNPAEWGRCKRTAASVRRAAETPLSCVSELTQIINQAQALGVDFQNVENASSPPFSCSPAIAADVQKSIPPAPVEATGSRLENAESLLLGIKHPRPAKGQEKARLATQDLGGITAGSGWNNRAHCLGSRLTSKWTSVISGRVIVQPRSFRSPFERILRAGWRRPSGGHGSRPRSAKRISPRQCLAVDPHVENERCCLLPE